MKYIYYRLVRFYSKTFGIKDSPGFLIHSCYSWGLLIVLTSIYFYFMSLESIILYYIGINIKKVFIYMLDIILFYSNKECNNYICNSLFLVSYLKKKIGLLH